MADAQVGAGAHHLNVYPGRRPDAVQPQHTLKERAERLSPPLIVVRGERAEGGICHSHFEFGRPPLG